MATTVTHIVDPNSGAGFDYDSLYDWDAGEQGNLTGVRDEIAVATCRCTGGTADSTAVTVNAWTTSATQYIKIWTDPAESYRHNGTYQTGNKYRLEIAGNSSAVTLGQSYIRIDGIAIEINPTTDNTYWCITWTDAEQNPSDNRISNCIGKSISSKGRGFIGSNDVTNLTITYTVWNTIAYNFNAAGWGVFYCGTGDSAPGSITATFYNCTVFSSAGRGFRRYLGANSTCVVKAINCAVFNCAANSCFLGTFDAASDYNAASDTTSPGDNSIDSLTASNEFVNVSAGTEDFDLKAGSSLIDTGLGTTPKTVFTNDIFGTTRPTTDGDWDIGAFEYVAAVSALSISVSEALSFAEALD